MLVGFHPPFGIHLESKSRSILMGSSGMPHRPTQKIFPLNGVMRRGVFATLLATTPMLPNLSWAEETSVSHVRQYSIGSGDLDQVLNRFASEAGILLSVDARLTSGKRSSGLQGRFNVDRGLEHVLAGSGLQAVYAQGGWSLQAVAQDGPLQLGVTKVNAAEALENAWGPVAGIIAKRSATGTKTDAALVEIPQTINVVTAAEINSRSAQSVTEALRYTPGITGGGFSDRVKIFDEPTSRGFTPTPLYLDGLHLPYGGGSTGGSLQIDPYTLERVEVLKGPASVLYGQNQPGGIVNMVSKRPTATPVHEVVLGGGSYDRKYGAFDLGGPIDDQGEFLYRLTGVVNDSSSAIDYASQNRMMLAPSLTWLPNDRTTITVFGQYQKDHDVPEAQGLPAYGTVKSTPNGRISRSLFLGEP